MAVHGEAERLTRLHDMIGMPFREGDRVIYLGDYAGCGAAVLATLSSPDASPPHSSRNRPRPIVADRKRKQQNYDLSFPLWAKLKGHDGPSRRSRDATRQPAIHKGIEAPPPLSSDESSGFLKNGCGSWRTGRFVSSRLRSNAVSKRG